MDFAPYQDTAPDQRRALSPASSTTPRRELSRSPPAGIQRNIASAIQSSQLPPPSHFGADIENDAPDAETYGNTGDIVGSGGSRRYHVNLFENSLPMRLDYEAVAAYVMLPPAGAVILLLIEHKSDYVR